MKLPSIKASAGIKIAIGIVAGIVVVIGGFLLVQNVFTKAADSAPRDLIISGITTNSAKVAWTTDQDSQGVVEYGSSPTALNLFAPETQKQKDHTVQITLLSPATSYYFQIRIGETKYDNGGVPWTFSTKSQDATASESATPTPIVLGGNTPTPAPSGIVPTPVDSTSTNAFGPLKGSTLRINPTAIPTQRISAPTPTIYALPTLPAYVCGETDCQQICLKIGSTCSTLDWMRSGCVGKVLLGSCFLVIPTPTWNPLTPTPTVNPITPTATTAPTSPTNTPGPTNPSYMN